MNSLISHDEYNPTEQGIMATTSLNASVAPRIMRVLLVEDSALLRETLLEILAGCEGLSFDGVASTQAGAISLLQQKPFDLMLVDIELAQGNGFEVIKATREASYPYPRPICVVLTNHAHAEYRTLAKKLDVEYFFDKSMDFELAIETIETESKKFLDPSKKN